MIGNLEPDERVLDDNVIIDQIAELINKFGWEPEDDIVVEVGGTVVSGIHQGENYNKKWATPYGVRKYNKDAFIVIKNNSRRDLVGSQPNPELIGHHLKEDITNEEISRLESQAPDYGVGK